ncbi:MAG: MutT/NUDIX family protein [Acidobacteria bacterium]|nr:MutT/NUDIX family protein [Acidobacteriota bacterium]
MRLRTAIGVGLLACAAVFAGAQEARVPDPRTLQQMAARFAPTDITADLSHLSDADRRVLAKLVEASKIVDALFLRQVWAGNDAMLADLARDQSPEGRARLHYFLINKGPWSRLDHDAPFVPGAPAKPAGANYYPEGVAKADLERWIQSLPEAERARATGFFTVIRRAGQSFTLVPYNVEYQGELARAAALLREAAQLAKEPTLKAFLAKRADAFLSNDYYESDVAWMELDGAIEPTIGPYEVYEDELFNYKAGFEAYVTVQDPVETAKLQTLAAELQDIEDHLPIDPKQRNPKIGGLAPITVVNEIYASGDGNRGVQTAAFNLPNDERVIREKGAKRVMLKNVQDAKFAKTLLPISKIVLPAAEQSAVSFDAFFTHIVVHELMHGLGPHSITVDGRKTTVRQELKDTYSALEEAKADISGLFAIQHMIDKGAMPKSLEQSLYTTYLASAFRSIRFGVNEAHGKGIAIQLNYLLDQRGFLVNADGSFTVNKDRIKEGVAGLTRDIMTIQADGNYAAAKALGEKMGVVRPPVQKALDKLQSIPVDIEPQFVTANDLLKAR